MMGLCLNKPIIEHTVSKKCIEIHLMFEHQFNSTAHCRVLVISLCDQGAAWELGAATIAQYLKKALYHTTASPEDQNAKYSFY
jgi:hypothetical protein